MSKGLLLEILRELRFLQDLDHEHLEKLAEIAELITFEDDKLIFREGDPAGFVYFIVSGGVRLEMCAPGSGCRRILTLGPGELLGWSSLLGQTRLTATARTINRTEAIQVHAGLLLTLCDHNPPFASELMRRTALALAKRLHATRIQLLDLYGDSSTSPAEAAAQGGQDAT